MPCFVKTHKLQMEKAYQVSPLGLRPRVQDCSSSLIYFIAPTTSPPPEKPGYSHLFSVWGWSCSGLETETGAQKAWEEKLCFSPHSGKYNQTKLLWGFFFFFKRFFKKYIGQGFIWSSCKRENFCQIIRLAFHASCPGKPSYSAATLSLWSDPERHFLWEHSESNVHLTFLSISHSISSD